jgi:hypothetical protein
VRVHKLSILEQVLEIDNKFLKGVFVLEFNGSFNDGLRKFVDVCTNYSVWFLWSAGRFREGRIFVCLLLLFV